MLILLFGLLVFGGLAGWFRTFAEEATPAKIMVLGCILAGVIAGLAAETLVVLLRFRSPRGGRPRLVVRMLGWNAVSALIVAGVFLGVLATPLVDAVRVFHLAAAYVIISVVGIILLHVSVLPTRRVVAATGESASTARIALIFAILNLTSMVVAVAAGRVYLWLAYPGVG